jgi:hypothetical protein
MMGRTRNGSALVEQAGGASGSTGIVIAFA